MKQVTLNIPENANLNEEDAQCFLAAKLYECGRLTLGQAATLAGLSKRVFADILSDYNVSLINYSSSDIKNDASRI